MEYGYVRVSSITQNIDRQLEELYRLGLSNDQVFIDKQSGKDFERTSYQKLKRKIKKDDLLIIKSIDRLGRNYDMIIEEWYSITKQIQADIFVIDMPLLDTRTDKTQLIGKFISDIVLQILSFVAQTEREFIKQRQAEGIKIAKEKGIKFGRPRIELPSSFDEISMLYEQKVITNNEASNLLNMSRGTFLKYHKKRLNEIILR